MGYNLKPRQPAKRGKHRMHQRPVLSLIVPTRGRPLPLRRFLDSIAATATHPKALEVVLVLDNDDWESLAVHHDSLTLKRVVVPPGLTMGVLNAEGYAASSGALVMLLNDDVVAQTRGWDVAVRRAANRFPDGIVLVHVNDTLFRDRLCTFPLTSRTFCELAGGICPREYQRYRIDDHVEDVFNLLAVLGQRRTVYLPDVIFEHRNTAERHDGSHTYESDPTVLALDAPRFEALFTERKELALRLMKHLVGRNGGADEDAWQRKLNTIPDSFALRVPGRQLWRPHRGRLVYNAGLLAHGTAECVRRVQNRYRQEGWVGVARAVGRRLGRLLPFASPSPSR
jgi:hypothetical protein